MKVEFHFITPTFSEIDNVKIYALRDGLEKRTFITYEGNGKLKLIQSEHGMEAPVFLEMRSDVFDDMVKAIIAYANNKGIKTDPETLLEGKLVATKEHLDDMRKIVMKQLDIKS